MKMQKKQFRIGECAKHLNVERFVIRFWEKEFNLKTDRSAGGQRFYSKEDLNMFEEIKTLLYQKGFTIAGAKQHISHKNHYALIASKKTFLNEEGPELLSSQKKFETQKKKFEHQLLDLYKKLHKLHRLL